MSFETGFFGVLVLMVAFATLLLVRSLIYEWKKENKVQLRVIETKVSHDGSDSFHRNKYEVLDGPHQGYTAWSSSSSSGMWVSKEVGDIVSGYCIPGADGKPKALKSQGDMYFPIYFIGTCVFVLCMYAIFESAF